MLTIDAMRQLCEAYDLHSSVAEREVLERLGNPSSDEIIDTALANLQSDDRNIRVLMLRVLKGQTGPKAMQGILAGLNDPKRRVREVAIKASGNYHSYSQITDRLKAMVTDDHETRRIRRIALDSLVGSAITTAHEVTPSDIQALESLAKVDTYRTQILFGLLQLDLTTPVEDMLREFVRNGTKDEAVMATRALCGFRVVNLGQFERSNPAQRYVVDNCDIAAGRVWYWVKREHHAALITGQLPPSKPEDLE